jgi:hypothetical protein
MGVLKTCARLGRCPALRGAPASIRCGGISLFPRTICSLEQLNDQNEQYLAACLSENSDPGANWFAPWFKFPSMLLGGAAAK